MTMTRGKLATACSGILALAVAIYASAIEPERVSLTWIAVPQGKLAATLAGRRVAILSDLHFSDSGGTPSEQVQQLLQEIQPDIILLAGDYVQWGSGPQGYERALEFLGKLRAPLGVFGVLGDADRSSSRKSCEFCHQPDSGLPASRHQVVFLKDERRAIPTPRGGVLIVGLDPGSEAPVTSLLGRLLAGNTPTILLSHSSVVYREIDPLAEVLTVSGDTHGGQVRLPSWLWRLTRLKPDPDHIRGFFQDGRKSLVVTSGIGTSRLHFRLGVSPEVVVLEFGQR